MMLTKKMQHTSGSGGLRLSDSGNNTPSQAIVDWKICCPCNGPLTESMIQCADSRCQVLQHIPCVVFPKVSLEGISPASSQFYCELCRISRSDPFLKTLAHLLYPVKLRVLSNSMEGLSLLRTGKIDFQITRAHLDLLKNAGYDIQVWCILLNDSVPFRLQWPRYPCLSINGFRVKTVDRPITEMLGVNGRDIGASISMYVMEGNNQITFVALDTPSRNFCLGVRLVKQQTIQQVVNLIPSEQEGESFNDALARIRRCVGGKAAADEDGDSDLEIITDGVIINLRCPVSGTRMSTASRFRECVHLRSFDLQTFIEINKRTKKWQCPICLKNYSLEDIIIDPYLNHILKMVQACDANVMEIEVRSDGSWRARRAKVERPFMNLLKWHLPNGSLSSLHPSRNGKAKSYQMSESKRSCGPLIFSCQPLTVRRQTCYGICKRLQGVACFHSLLKPKLQLQQHSSHQI